MRKDIELVYLAVAIMMSSVSVASAKPTLKGKLTVWHPVTIIFAGPEASETDSSPNPFFDIRLEVVFLVQGIENT